jgi:hypothetical protein
MLEVFLSSLAELNSRLVVCTVSDYFSLSLLLERVLKHGLEAEFLAIFRYVYPLFYLTLYNMNHKWQTPT